MGKLGTLLKWTTKFGLAGGAVYVATTEKFFGTQQETLAAYERLKKTVTESEAYAMLPAAPKLPEEVTNSLPDVSANAIAEHKRGVRHKWNAGVLWTFNKIDNLPGTVSSYSKDLYNSVAELAGEDTKKDS